jgi:hypothetical protein
MASKMGKKQAWIVVDPIVRPVRLIPLVPMASKMGKKQAWIVVDPIVRPVRLTPLVPMASKTGMKPVWIVVAPIVRPVRLTPLVPMVSKTGMKPVLIAVDLTVSLVLRNVRCRKLILMTSIQDGAFGMTAVQIVPEVPLMRNTPLEEWVAPFD